VEWLVDEADGEGLLVELEVELLLLLSERCWARSSGETKSRATVARLEGRIGHLLPDGESKERSFDVLVATL